jgi:hypothetical protein
MFFNGRNGDIASFRLADHAQQTGLGSIISVYLSMRGRWQDRQDQQHLVTNRINRADVVDKFPLKIIAFRQGFTFGQHLGQ